MGEGGHWDRPTQKQEKIRPATFGDEGSRPRLSPHEIRLAKRRRARERPEELARAAQRAAILSNWGPQEHESEIKPLVAKITPKRERVSPEEYDEPHEFNGFPD